jgi:hypothetical protein
MWRVFPKPTLLDHEHVISYLGRYVHRLAIANSWLQSMRDGNVTFVTKHDDIITITAEEFISAKVDEGESHPDVDKQTWQDLLLELTGSDAILCPRCKFGKLTRYRIERRRTYDPWNPPPPNTS